jgi:GWxTD domain-containing protein
MKIFHGLSKSTAISLILIFLSGCGILGPPALDTKPVNLYNPGKSSLNPQYTVYHNGSGESTLFFRIMSGELLFNQANPENITQANIKIDYKLYSSFVEKVLQSSGSKEFKIDREKNINVFTGSLKIPLDDGKSYFLEVSFTDQLREMTEVDYVFVDRFSEKSQQNYLILSYPDNEVGFEKFYYSDEQFRIIYNQAQSGTVDILYYNPVRVLPPPPFVTSEIDPRMPEPDSIFQESYSQQTLFSLDRRGLYQFAINGDRLNALYLVNLGDNFPQVRSPEDMAPPLQYITTSEEYQNIIKQEDLKRAIDDFWVKTGKDFNNARELIKVYYNRVLFANLYYTTDREGWKTDRGMIYLIFGPPSMVKKTETREEWHYQSPTTRRHYRFEFTLESDPIKAYDFYLNRTEGHRDIWNAAVRTWREGRIYSL